MKTHLQSTVAAVALALAGCTDTSGLPPAPQYPEAVRAAYSQPYYLKPGDVLAIRLMLNPELNDEQVVVGPDGHIATSVIRDEIAGGKTLEELTASLLKSYSRDLKNPRITVAVRQFGATPVFVAGEVALPGQFDSPNGRSISLIQAVARAGGLKESADSGNIFIIRRPAMGAEAVLLSTSYDKATHAIDASADILLAPYDVVYIPKSGIAVVGGLWRQYVEQFAHPSFGFNYLVGGNGSVVTGPTTTTTVAPTPAGTR